jgi:hypothetical protein
MELAVEYTRNAEDKRPSDAPVYHVKSGREPRLFVSAFHGWDRYSFLLFSLFLSFLSLFFGPSPLSPPLIFVTVRQQYWTSTNRRTYRSWRTCCGSTRAPIL